MTVGILTFLVVVLSGCEKQAPPQVERPPAPVSVAAAVKDDVPVYIDSIGKIVAREVVSIQPQVSGRIIGIHFADGAEVKAGQLLFTIDPRPFRAQLAAAEANLAQARAALDLAKINFARVENVADSRAVSRQDYDAKKNAVAVAEAQVKQGLAAVENARINLDYCTIRSPIDGRAGERLVDIGNVVSANSGSLLVIQSLDPIYADFTVPQNDLTAVQRNMTRGALRVEVRLPDLPDKPREGKLSFLDNAVQEGTGTVRLRSTIPNRDRLFWPGRFVNVRLILDVRRGAVLIPAAAPQMSAQGSFVYVVKEDSTAELRPVKLGQRQGDLVVVTDGILAGEQVVVAGQLGVTPGGKVNPSQPGATATPNQPTPADKPS
ncbi:MAG TPA: efflux RND transporter periplasmic adaptor subunit [Candidatus Eisenbacteria bacterium]|nr:efflux RND transporter periplasmic adaptor subunit [Candidatus Eisenbacteria bacterium]